MQSRNSQIRALGQRSITSSLAFRISKDSKEVVPNKELSNKGSSISLSAFLDKKLPRNPSLPCEKVKGKLRPFCSPLGVGGFSGDHQIGVKNPEAEGRKSIIDQMVFEQFKCTGDAEKGDGAEDLCDGGDKGTASAVDQIGLCQVGEAGSSNFNDNVQVESKWRNAFKGVDHKQSSRKRVLVLGSDTKPRQRRRGKSSGRFTGNKRTRPSYNHYANGSGWWDCDMEGVDTEEVGYGEIWEGVGSTTFGGIEWH